MIIAQAKGHKYQALAEVGDFLLKQGIKRVLIVGPTPHWNMDLPRIVLRKLWVNTPERTFLGNNEKFKQDNDTLKTAFAKTPQLIYVDLMSFFCNEQGCLIRIGENKKTGITSWDYGHLTPVASDYLAKNMLVERVVNYSNTLQID